MASWMLKRTVGGLCVATLLTLSARVASAQIAPVDEDLPTPLAEREDEQQVVKKQPARSGPRPSDPRVGFDWPDLTPSATISAHLNFTDFDNYAQIFSGTSEIILAQAQPCRGMPPFRHVAL